jgi:hypothetical protein
MPSAPVLHKGSVYPVIADNNVGCDRKTETLNEHPLESDTKTVCVPEVSPVAVCEVEPDGDQR